MVWGTGKFFVKTARVSLTRFHTTPLRQLNMTLNMLVRQLSFMVNDIFSNHQDDTTGHRVSEDSKTTSQYTATGRYDVMYVKFQLIYSLQIKSKLHRKGCSPLMGCYSHGLLYFTALQMKILKQEVHGTT